jgi:hypothetical protein
VEDVVRRRRAVEGGGPLALQRHRRPQLGREGTEVAAARARAHRHGHARAAAPAGDQVARDLQLLVEVSARLAHERGVVGAEPTAADVVLERLDEVDHAGVDEVVVGEPRQGGDLPAAALGAAGGHVGGLVPGQQRGRLQEVRRGGEAFAKPGESRWGIGHAACYPARV